MAGYHLMLTTFAVPAEAVVFNQPARSAYAQHFARRFLQERTASTVVEFAIISVPFIFTLMLIACVAVILFMHQQLDRAASKAARQVMNETMQKNGCTGPAYRAQVLCAYLPSAFSCSGIIVNLQTASEGKNPAGYYRIVKANATRLVIPHLSNATAKYRAGVQGSYAYLQIIYPITFLPAFVMALITTRSYNGVPASLAVSTVAFRNEQ